MVLLRRAITSDSLQTRETAVAELKKRPMFTYVPLLIAAFPDTVTTEACNQVYLLPGGDTISEVQIRQKSRHSEFYIASAFYADFYARDVQIPTVVGWKFGLAAARKQVAPAQAFVSHALQEEENHEQLRDRIRFVLRQTTGFSDSNDPELWEKQWADYNGSYRTSYIEQPYRSYSARSVSLHVVRLCSCFPAGTPVMTLLGTMPIEKVVCGDRVLAQNPETGELTFKTVQGITLRTAAPLVKLQLGSNVICCTAAHPFWIVGEGWRIAKQIKPRDRLHGINGAVPVDAVGEIRETEAYNLIVSDFHTYFVGESSLLVHDNSPLLETSAGLPGLEVTQP